MLPKESVVSMQMSISDGMKLIISGGAVVPPYDHNDRNNPKGTHKTKRPPSPVPVSPANEPRPWLIEITVLKITQTSEHFLKLDYLSPSKRTRLRATSLQP